MLATDDGDVTVTEEKYTIGIDGCRAQFKFQFQQSQNPQFQFKFQFQQVSKSSIPIPIPIPVEIGINSGVELIPIPTFPALVITVFPQFRFVRLF